MSTAVSELGNAKLWLEKSPVSKHRDHAKLVSQLEQVARSFGRASQDQHRAMIANFHQSAEPLPYFQDMDIGALILEAAADASTDAELRSFLYGEAKLRAVWCAGNASAGGEGAARAMHIRRLKEKLMRETEGSR